MRVIVEVIDNVDGRCKWLVCCSICANGGAEDELQTLPLEGAGEFVDLSVEMRGNFVTRPHLTCSLGVHTKILYKDAVGSISLFFRVKRLVLQLRLRGWWRSNGWWRGWSSRSLGRLLLVLQLFVKEDPRSIIVRKRVKKDPTSWSIKARVLVMPLSVTRR